MLLTSLLLLLPLLLLVLRATWDGNPCRRTARRLLLPSGAGSTGGGAAAAALAAAAAHRALATARPLLPLSCMPMALLPALLLSPRQQQRANPSGPKEGGQPRRSNTLAVRSIYMQGPDALAGWAKERGS